MRRLDQKHMTIITTNNNNHQHKQNKFHTLKPSCILTHHRNLRFLPCLHLGFTFNQRRVNYQEFPLASYHIQSFLKLGIHIKPTSHHIFNLFSNLGFTFIQCLIHQDFITTRLDMGFTPH